MIYYRKIKQLTRYKTLEFLLFDRCFEGFEAPVIALKPSVTKEIEDGNGGFGISEEGFRRLSLLLRSLT